MTRAPHLLTAALTAMFTVRSLTAPSGLTVQNGVANAITTGSQTSITVSHNALLNWSSFNLAPNETVTFIQPSAASVVWNRIQDPNPSQIWGRLDANGIVVLMNPAGFHFGPSASVTAAGLIVSTAPATPIETAAGLFWQFSGPPPQASIINYGQLSVGGAGSLFLIADHIENHGALNAPEGIVGLIAAQEVRLTDRPDGRGLSANVKLPSGSIANDGRLLADAGTIALHAQVVNQNGLVQANSVRERNGVIELVASDAVALGEQSRLEASGDASNASAGGKVLIRSGGSFSDAIGSRIEVPGGGGNGGSVEISAPVMSALHSTIDGQAGPGGLGGTLLIDPQDIVLGQSGSGQAAAGTVGFDDPPEAGALNLDVNTAFVGLSQITLQASRNLTVSAGTLWDLASSTGRDEPGSLLRLEAGQNLTIGSGATLNAGEHWSVTLEAGRDFAAGSGAVTPGAGNLTFAGTAALQAGRGDLHLRAGNNVTVGAGFVRTLGGGNISVEALAGSINTGTKANGYRFLPSGYLVDLDLGGISTANGGAVRLSAGLDVTSYLPLAGGSQSDAGSGAFGDAPGNVTVTAGRDVSGHFVVRQGEGKITAGRNAGTASRLLALSLVRGGWEVAAGNDILLQEVRNPNGVFNNLGSSSSPHRHRFDYSPDAYATLEAGHRVELRGTALPRYPDAFSQGLPPIYPGTLDIRAGAGGVLLGNDLVQFPSPVGGLRVVTRDGGPLVGAKSGDLTQWIVSDSGRTQYRAFGDFGLSDHAATPIHATDPDPVRLDISGDMTAILLGVPKRAEIQVGGNLINSRFDGQNLHDDDVTRIHVAGDILNRNEFTRVTSAVAPNFALFDPGLIYPPLSPTLTGIENRFFYQAASGTLTFQGRMTGEELQALLSLQVRSFDANGLPVVLADGEPATQPATFVPSDVLQSLFVASQDVPLNPDTGYRLGGGGRFEVQAHDLDLGATVGIVSQGPRANAALAERFSHGADIEIRLGGDLSLFSSKIASLNGGSIHIVAEGSVAVGSRDFQVSDAAARGIFTTDPSDVTVVARGHINVNGSRIAAYDGGNVTVRSLEGNVDAGTGGSGSAIVEKLAVDPVTREIRSYAPTIPGSGILATTFPPSQDPAFPASSHTVGNIRVETPRGDILASAGGVVQIPLNGIGTGAGTVTLLAGTTDAAGQVIYRGNIDASGSGVIGSTVTLEASGDIRGLVFARENIDLRAQQNVNVTALAQGSVNVGAGGNVSGAIIGVGSVSATGAAVDAALLSQNISAGGDVSSAQVGFAQGTAAAATSQSVSGDEQVRDLATEKDTQPEPDEPAKKSQPRLARTAGRVTVILPDRTQ